KTRQRMRAQIFLTASGRPGRQHDAAHRGGEQRHMRAGGGGDMQRRRAILGIATLDDAYAISLDPAQEDGLADLARQAAHPRQREAAHPRTLAIGEREVVDTRADHIATTLYLLDGARSFERFDQ